MSTSLFLVLLCKREYHFAFFWLCFEQRFTSYFVRQMKLLTGYPGKQPAWQAMCGCVVKCSCSRCILCALHTMLFWKQDNKLVHWPPCSGYHTLDSRELCKVLEAAPPFGMCMSEETTWSVEWARAHLGGGRLPQAYASIERCTSSQASSEIWREEIFPRF